VILLTQLRYHRRLSSFVAKIRVSWAIFAVDERLEWLESLTLEILCRNRGIMPVVEPPGGDRTSPTLTCVAWVPVMTFILRFKSTFKRRVLKSLTNTLPICVQVAVMRRVMELLGTSSQVVLAWASHKL
jgi:hypothetical protein